MAPLAIRADDLDTRSRRRGSGACCSTSSAVRRDTIWMRLNELTRLIEPPAWVTTPPLARHRDDFRRSAAGRAAAQDSRFVAAVRELRVSIAGTGAKRNGNVSDSRYSKVPGAMIQVSRLQMDAVRIAGVCPAVPGRRGKEAKNRLLARAAQNGSRTSSNLPSRDREEAVRRALNAPDVAQTLSLPAHTPVGARSTGVRTRRQECLPQVHPGESYNDRTLAR